jgi:phosphopantetheinyl transferase (holo-ACP synthase)
MIGNDIVDLDIVLKENKASNLRYLNKICTENEIKTIQGSIDPNITLWRIWTIKEAAYKIINKSNGIRAYIPKKIETVYPLTQILTLGKDEQSIQRSRTYTCGASRSHRGGFGESLSRNQKEVCGTFG